MVPTFFVALLFVYGLVHMAPGGPLDSLVMKMRKNSGVSQTQGTRISSERLKEIKTQYGLDLPLHKRFFHWLGNMLRLDFGQSFSYGRPVLEVIKDRLPVSLQFGLGSFIFGYAGTICLGCAMAARSGKALDRFLRYSLVLFSATPVLLIALFFIIFFASDMGASYFPHSLYD